MKRTFIALDISPTSKLKENYELIRYRLRLERINWIQASNLHITLNFLGDTPEHLIPEIAQKIEKCVKGQSVFELGIRSFGVFKNLREPRVIWMGCDPSPSLEPLKRRLDADLSGLGFKPENRPFSPHLTLGRMKEIRQHNQLAQLVTLLKDVEFQKQQVDKITFYESKLTSVGAEYIPVQTFAFK